MTSGDESISEIQKCFKGTNVFVTGATGFIGSVLVEKILRYLYYIYYFFYFVIHFKNKFNPSTRF